MQSRLGCRRLRSCGADDPGKFIPVKLWVADSTIERLAELLSARPQGVVV